MNVKKFCQDLCGIFEVFSTTDSPLSAHQPKPLPLPSPFKKISIDIKNKI